MFTEVNYLGLDRPTGKGLSFERILRLRRSSEDKQVQLEKG